MNQFMVSLSGVMLGVEVLDALTRGKISCEDQEMQTQTPVMTP
ncbi:hypothetical protein V5R04_03270 [Jonesiaceae bacterium BS-20]|uniref:Uncharacterized protein n=1 Tax=Jonesiaceae bacterium BS-20 TaxID=3120821 RepID=A0AAU7DYY9_9MICO